MYKWLKNRWFLLTTTFFGILLLFVLVFLTSPAGASLFGDHSITGALILKGGPAAMLCYLDHSLITPKLCKRYYPIEKTNNYRIMVFLTGIGGVQVYKLPFHQPRPTPKQNTINI